MSTSLDNVKVLREKTGAGMVDCKKALEEAGGDMEAAMESLRKKGIAKAAKRTDRVAAEGLIKVDVDADGREGYMLELNSESDFVAKNDDFQKFADQVMSLVKEQKPANVDELMELPIEDVTVREKLENLSGVIGEKLVLHRVAVLSSQGTVAAYTHMGGKIGVLVALDQADKHDLAYDMAMQVAAATPTHIYPEDVPEAELEKEKNVYREQLKQEGKPEDMIEKIVEGKMNKYYEQVCLAKQEYIKEDKKKVEEVLGDVKVENFIRFSLQ